MHRSARAYLPSRPAQFFSPSSVFREDATKLARSVSQVYKEKLANQFYYSKVGEAGKFFGYAEAGLTKANGYSEVGYGGTSENGNINVNWKTGSYAVYHVSPSTPRVKVWLVENAKSEAEEGKEEILRPPGANNNLQASWESVPIPDVFKIPFGQIAPPGGKFADKAVQIICDATGEYWEFYRFGQFEKGSHFGEFKAVYGAYKSAIGSFNGVNGNGWGANATHLAIVGGAITSSDIVRVLRGGQIEHAIAVSALVTKNEHLAPAVSNDFQENTHEKVPASFPGGELLNPAYKKQDEIPEGLWCAFPASSHPNEFLSIKGTISERIFEAMRDHGLYVSDRSGAMSFFFAGLQALGTPYADIPINPVHGYSGTSPSVAEMNSQVNNYIPSGWGVDPKLPTMTQAINGAAGWFSGFPWRALEQLEPRAS